MRQYHVLAMTEAGHSVWQGAGTTPQVAISACLVSGLGHFWAIAPEGFTIEIVPLNMKPAEHPGLRAAMDMHVGRVKSSKLSKNDGVVEGEA